MASSKELNTVWAKFAPVKSKVKEQKPQPVIEIKCSCRAEIVGNGFKIRRKGEQCNIKWHGTPKDPKPPKHKPIWFASEAELPAKLRELSTVTLSGLMGVMTSSSLTFMLRVAVIVSLASVTITALKRGCL